MAYIHPPEAFEAVSLSDQAYYRLRELIVTLDLQPGSVINERELMERLGVGRTPIREALRTLEREQLVEVYPRRGIFVSRIDVGDLAGLSEVRGSLEAYAAGLAATRHSEADREVALGLLDELDRAHGDERRLIELDQRIHRHVWACAKNPFLAATLEGYYALTLRIWLVALDRVARLDGAVVDDNRTLIETILERDAGRAVEAMRRHVEAFERSIRAAL